MKRQYFATLALIYLIFTIVFYRLGLSQPGYNYWTLQAANTVMALLSLISFLLVTRTIDDRPQLFIRGIYSGSLLKLFVCMTAILVYVMIYRTHIHKPTVFIFFGIYIVYTVVETIVLSKAARTKK